MITAVQLQQVHKRYPSSDRWALGPIDLSIEQGEIFGFLGPNGSGKTTLQKIISGMLLPDGGTVQLFGRDVTRVGPGPHRPVGHFFQGERSFYWRLSVRKNIELFAALSGCSGVQTKVRLAQLSEQLELSPYLETPFGSLSAGTKQKVSLLRTLITEPQILVMDEVTATLDPRTVREVYTIVRQLSSRQGFTVIWATHNLAEAEALCQRVALFNQGQVVTLQSTRELAKQYFAALDGEELISSVV